jgi:protein-tyrosine phosphatase
MPRRVLQIVGGNVHASREADDLVLHLRESWRSASLEVHDVTAASAPRRLRAEAREGALRLAGLPREPRPLLRLVFPDGREEVVAERLLPLVGPQNFRDLGGYPAADGRRVRWGCVFRADSLALLTDDDVAFLERLGLRTVCDLRGDDELELQPNPLRERAGLRYWHHPVGEKSVAPDEWRRRFESGELGEIGADWLLRGYVRMVDERAEHLGAALAAFARAESLPLVFHCTAGKDRTGVLAALLLLALGVPREVVIGDYALTALFTGDRIRAAEPWFRERGIEPEQVVNLVSARPENMAALLDHLDARHGGPERFLVERANVGDETLAALRENLLA